DRAGVGSALPRRALAESYEPASAVPRRPGTPGRSAGAQRPRERRRAAHLEPVLSGRRGGPAADEPGPGGHLLLNRVGVLQRFAVAVAGVAGDGGAGRAAGLGDAVQPEPFADRAGGR